MKILVCLKQVPAPENKFTFSSLPPGYQEEGITYKTNNYDEFAMEEALCIQDAFPDTEITAISLGPPRADSTLLRAMEMGAKESFHILDPSSSKRDAQSVAFMIAHWARQKKFDLILTGIMSEDNQQGQTGPLLAAILDLPYATAVTELKWQREYSRMRVTKEKEDGYLETIEIPLPALLTIQTSTHTPRYPNLTNKLRARKAAITTIHPPFQKIPRQGAELLHIDPPKETGTAIHLSGSLNEKAEALLTILEKKQLL